MSKTRTFAITIEPLAVECHIWHGYSVNETLSNYTKLNDLMTFILKIANLDFVAAWNIQISQTHLFIYVL